MIASGYFIAAKAKAPANREPAAQRLRNDLTRRRSAGWRIDQMPKRSIEFNMPNTIGIEIAAANATAKATGKNNHPPPEGEWCAWSSAAPIQRTAAKKIAAKQVANSNEPIVNCPASEFRRWAQSVSQAKARQAVRIPPPDTTTNTEPSGVRV